MTTTNTIKTVFLIVLMTALLIVIGKAIGGTSGMLIAFVFAIGMNFFSYWFSDKIVLKMYKAQEVTAEENPITVTVEDDKGNSVIEELTISNIDKKGPSVTYMPDGGTYVKPKNSDAIIKTRNAKKTGGRLCENSAIVPLRRLRRRIPQGGNGIRLIDSDRATPLRGERSIPKEGR